MQSWATTVLTYLSLPREVVFPYLEVFPYLLGWKRPGCLLYLPGWAQHSQESWPEAWLPIPAWTPCSQGDTRLTPRNANSPLTIFLTLPLLFWKAVSSNQCVKMHILWGGSWVKNVPMGFFSFSWLSKRPLGRNMALTPMCKMLLQTFHRT